jgi:hypothetical protein
VELKSPDLGNVQGGRRRRTRQQLRGGLHRHSHTVSEELFAKVTIEW